MNSFPVILRSLVSSCILMVVAAVGSPGLADDAAAADESQGASGADPQQAAGETSSTESKGESKPTQEKPASKPPAHVALLKDAKKISGLLTFYKKNDNLYAELGSSHYDTDFLVLISIARGIGQGVILPGMTWKGEDDWLWRLKKVDRRVLVVRRNVRFRAASGSPQAAAVENAYTDSILFSLPIVAKGPGGGDLVDFSLVFMTDLPQISQVLKGFAFSKSRSTWSDVKAFPDNVELQVSATYASNGSRDFVAVPDSRGVTVNVHYSISKLAKTGYVPRLADERIGYFVTALMDYSKKTYNDRFVRYINRWDLRKADSSAKLSPPKKPIVFWIENTVPFQFRKPIREGILEWNKAFEKAGFLDAIEVRQQPEKSDWDPEDINYNTVRWITAGAAIAYGPSRVDPNTGQILDADILIDADFMQYPEELYEIYTEKSAGRPGLPGRSARTGGMPFVGPPAVHHGCQLHQGLARELAFGATVMARKADPAELEAIVMTGLRAATMHEVGHTLGLRHNFKASTNRSIEELNDREYLQEHGPIASVMDYIPINLVTEDMKQGPFYPHTIGTYDYWAIEYGYRPVSGSSPDAELKELGKIASRGSEPGHAYGSDEDTRRGDADPLSERFDLGKDPLEFGRFRAKLVAEQLPGLVDRVTAEGDNYYQARRAFGILLSSHGTAMQSVSRLIGGVYVHRHRKGDKDAPAPFVVVDAQQQREALELLEQQVFSDQPFAFPPELYNHLASPRWTHWGTNLPERVDYPVHRVILAWQNYILNQLLSPQTLGRLHDSELKVPSDQDAFTVAELVQRLTRTVFAEVDNLQPGEFTNRQPAISSLRRNLQRTLLERLSMLAMGNTTAPFDCQTIARAELQSLQTKLDKLLANDQLKLDDYTRAHLDESTARIGKVLEAQLELSHP